MPNYSALTIHSVFEDIWSTWPNKNGEAAALKAVTFFLKEHTKEELLKACEMYVLDNTLTDPSFVYKLSNFLNLDHWIDTLESNNLDKLRARRDAAIEVIEEWNKACRPHWIKVVDIESRIPLAMLALDNKFFASNWKDALNKATKIFAYQFRDEDPRSKININFKWLTDVSFNRHVVTKIMEGDYGSAAKERIVEIYKKKEIDYEARRKLAEEMRLMFPEIKFEQPSPKEVAVKEKLILTKDAVEMANKIKGELGSKLIKQYSKNDTEKIAQEIQRGISNKVEHVRPDEVDGSQQVGEGDNVDGESVDEFTFE